MERNCVNGSADILFEVIGRAGVVTLNKPQTLNAVTDAMLTALNHYLDIWEADDAVERIIIKAVPGRAFSAGGDIRHLYERGLAKDYDFDFFAREYQLNARIATFPKPYIALVDGIAMGGGVGISFHGHVVAGENIAFAMPEVGIGFFPDVGASHFLNKAPSEMALYLGLTGNRLNQAECMTLGLAGSTCKSADVNELLHDLCHGEDLQTVLSQYQDQVQASTTPVLEFSDLIKRAFLKPNMSAILIELKIIAADDGLSDDQREWASKTLKLLNQKSPTSLLVARRQIVEGRNLSAAECMNMEFRILKRILVGVDFYEGIRAAIIDKDRNPIWKPASLAEVDLAKLDEYFDDLGDEELRLT